MDQLRRGAELGGDLAPATERLDGPDALRRLLDDGGQVALLVLHLPGRREVSLVKSRLIQNSGTAPAATTTASGQYRWSSRITTVT